MFHCRVRTAALAIAILLVATGVPMAAADVSFDEMLRDGDLRETFADERKRQAMQAQIEHERQAAEKRERLEAERLAREEAERRRLLDERPWPVRLTEMRCLACHDTAAYDDKVYTRIGWELVVLRMQWFNGAGLEAGERAVIAGHLASLRPAGIGRRLAEWTLAALTLILPPAAFIAWRHRRRTRPSPTESST